MTEPTPQLVKDLWGHMTSHYKSQVINKDDSTLMALVADTLAFLGIQDRKTFLETFTTTLAKTIFTPFEIGDPNDPQYTLWEQITICVHEHQHVEQFVRENVVFAAKYLTNGAQRAAYEAEAYVASMEMDWWRYKTLREPAHQAARLVSYGCTHEEIESAAQIIALSQEPLKLGGVVSASAAVAIDWLEAHAPDIKAA